MTKKRRKRARGENSIRHGIEIGAVLQGYFDNPPYIPPGEKFGFRWTPKLLASRVGVTDSAVRQWLNGVSLPSLSLPTIISVIFGPKPEQFTAEINALWDLLRLCEGHRNGRYGRQGSSGTAASQGLTTTLRGDAPTAASDDRQHPKAEVSAKATMAVDASSASLTALESYRDQAERLRSEQRTNARQSAQLLAAEAARCNRTGNYDAGMRFALAGWLATTKENVECIPEIVKQLEHGARGIRLLFKEAGACLHAHMRDSMGSDVFLISREGELYAHNLASGNRVNIVKFGSWFALSKLDWTIVSQGENDHLSIVSLASKIGAGQVVELIWPARIGGIVYWEGKYPYREKMDLSADGDILLRSSRDHLSVSSIKRNAETISYKRPEGLFGWLNVLSSSGDFLVSNWLHKKQAIWDARSGRQICDLNAVCNDASSLSWASFTEDCKKLFIRFGSGVVYCLSMPAAALQAKIPLDHPIAHSSDGAMVAGCVNNQINVFHITSLKYLYRESESQFVNYELEFSADNSLLYTQKATTINALDIKDNFNLAFKTLPGDEVHHFELSKGGAILLTNNLIPDFEYQVYSVKAFDALTGRRLVYLSPSIAIAAAPDDSLIATNGDDKTTIYDRKGLELTSIYVRDWQSRLQFSLDGNLLYQMQGSIDTEVERIAGSNHVYIFDVRFENKSLRQLVELICEFKLVGKGLFLEEDLTDALYRNVPFDVVNQCRVLLTDHSS